MHITQHFQEQESYTFYVSLKSNQISKTSKRAQLCPYLNAAILY